MSFFSKLFQSFWPSESSARGQEKFSISEDFDFADLVATLNEFPEVKEPLVVLLRNEESVRDAALVALIRRTREMEAPQRLVSCLAMLRDPALTEDFLKEIDRP